MKRTSLTILGLVLSFGLGFFIQNTVAKQPEKSTLLQKTTQPTAKEGFKLGAFSVSLSVKDLKASKQFYESLGFTVLAGKMEQHYLIMKNESTLIGLFQGMFENSILTFNPGWDENGKNLATFDDVRTIQRQLKKNNIQLTSEADLKTTGPASITLTDPDGNAILFDQHR